MVYYLGIPAGKFARAYGNLDGAWFSNREAELARRNAQRQHPPTINLLLNRNYSPINDLELHPHL